MIVHTTENTNSNHSNTQNKKKNKRLTTTRTVVEMLLPPISIRFPSGTLQACKAGQPLAKGFFGVCWAVLGDLDYYVAGLNLPSYNNAHMPCSLCRCSLSGPATWSNFTAGAPWRATMWTPETWHAWEGKSTNPLFQEVPGMSVLQVCCDYMHSKYLERTWWSLTRLTMFVRKSGGPKLRGKAAEIRHFAEVLLSLWQSHCDNTQLVHRQITLLLKKNVMMERLMTEHHDKLFFEDDEARAFEQACSDMLLLHADLAKYYAGLGKQYFFLDEQDTHVTTCCPSEQMPESSLGLVFRRGRFSTESSKACLHEFERQHRSVCCEQDVSALQARSEPSI